MMVSIVGENLSKARKSARRIRRQHNERPSPPFKDFSSDSWIFTAYRNKEPGLNQPFKPGTCGVDVRTLRVASQRFSDSRELLSRSALTN
jgi:hypothetical protein